MSATPEQKVSFGGETITYRLERTSRRKTVAISVGFDGIRVLAPADMNDSDVNGYVRKKAPWVLKKQSAYRDLATETQPKEFVSGESFHYLGRPYRLRVIEDPAAVLTRVAARGQTLVAPVLPQQNELVRRSAIRSGLRHWYMEKAKARFPERLGIVSSALGISRPALRVVDQSKRWGSCDKSGKIRLNWRLVMAPTSLIDYVIAHEACHVLEHNHSHRYWRSLETIMTDYESRIERLDRTGHRLIW
jgi:predicted metal-dependent hydrolase